MLILHYRHIYAMLKYRIIKTAVVFLVDVILVSCDKLRKWRLDCNGVDLSYNKGVAVSQVRLFQAPRKISFTFHFWHKSFILHDVKLVELSNNSFEYKNVTFRGGGVKTYSNHNYIFSGPQPVHHRRPCSNDQFRQHGHTFLYLPRQNLKHRSQ